MIARDVAYFAAEMGVYTAVVVTGWRHHPAAGIAAVLAMAVWWGALHSPRAPIHLPAPIDLALRLTWFGIGAACLGRLTVDS